MTECDALSERMPAVAHGRSAWTAAEQDHLLACADCGAEWRVVQAAAVLGTRLARRVDPDRVAQGALAAAGAARRMRRWARLGVIGGLAAAAAVTLLVWKGPARPPADDHGPAATAFVLPVAELDGLDSLELGAVLETLEAPIGEGSTVEMPGFNGLDDQQLEQVLHGLEG
jgi:hypothetical protein